MSGPAATSETLAGDHAGVLKAHVARLFFERGLPKREIARRLGISRFKVARLLEQAREEGIVRIEVRDPIPLADDLARALEHAHRLELALVVRAAAETDPSELLARTAAMWLTELLRPGDILGVAWGSTIQRVAHSLETRPARPVPVVQICGAIPSLAGGVGPMEVAWQFAERLGGPLYALPVPAIVEARDELLRHEAVAPTVAMFERVSFALVGIDALVAAGASARASAGIVVRDGLPAGAIGNILVHTFGADGTIVADRLAARAIQLSVEQLRRARVMAVAGGADKAEPILAALRTGLLDILVTDDVAAAAAVR